MYVWNLRKLNKPSETAHRTMTDEPPDAELRAAEKLQIASSGS